MPESASSDEVLGAEGIMHAGITTGSNLPGPVRLRQESASDDQSRESKENTTANTRLNPTKRWGTG